MIRTHRAGGLLGLLSALGVAGCGSSSSDSPVSSGETFDAGRDAIGADAKVPTDAAADVAVDAGTFAKVPLSGCSPSYTMNVTLGGSQQFSLLLDTATTTLGVAAQGCTSCTSDGVSPLYTPGSGAVDEGAHVTAVYDVGEIGWTGEIYQDTVSVAGLATRPKFGAIQTDTGHFLLGSGSCDTPSGLTPWRYQGIIGFASDDVLLPGTTSYFDGLVNDGLVPDVFAINLCHMGGTLWLGGYDPKATTATPQYTPMTFEHGYNVMLAEIDVAGGDAGVDVQVPMGEQIALNDSGGPSIILPDDVFRPLTNAISQNPSFQAWFGASWPWTSLPSLGSCVDLMETPDQVDAALPPLTLKLGTTSLIDVQVPATQAYLSYTYHGQVVTYCQDMFDFTSIVGPDAGPDAGPIGIRPDLGESLMRGHVLIYDRANHRLGIAPANPCP
jgi:hypothetical protein